MNIVMISVYPAEHEPSGGVYSVTKALSQTLSKYGDLNVQVLTVEPEKRKILIEQDGQVTIHRLPGSRWPQILDIFAGPGKKRLLSYCSYLKPDVLHIHGVYGLGLGDISIPHVFTVHGFDHANLVANRAKLAYIRSRLWKIAERRGLAAQKHIISITPYVRMMIEPLTHASIYDIDNPVDERFFNVMRRPEPGRVLCVGWINERKNTLGSVEAFARIADRYKEARLVIAGVSMEVEYFNRVKQNIAKYGIGDRVELLGHVNHVQLEQELVRASVFLLPSRQENSPMAIAEAMAAGIPVIASNRCGMPYMVQEDHTGFLIDPESTKQIADRLTQLLEFPQLCERMGQAGRQVAMERFHPRVVAEKTIAVYEQICRSGS